MFNWGREGGSPPLSSSLISVGGYFHPGRFQVIAVMPQELLAISPSHPWPHTTCIFSKFPDAGNAGGSGHHVLRTTVSDKISLFARILGPRGSRTQCVRASGGGGRVRQLMEDGSWGGPQPEWLGLCSCPSETTCPSQCLMAGSA